MGVRWPRFFVLRFVVIEWRALLSSCLIAWIWFCDLQDQLRYTLPIVGSCCGKALFLVVVDQMSRAEGLSDLCHKQSKEGSLQTRQVYANSYSTWHEQPPTTQRMMPTNTPPHMALENLSIQELQMSRHDITRAIHDAQCHRSGQ